LFLDYVKSKLFWNKNWKETRKVFQFPMRSDFWLNNWFLHLIYFLPFHKTNLLISKNKVLSRKLILLIFNSSKSQQTFLVIFLPPKYFCFFLRKIFFFFQKKKSFTKKYLQTCALKYKPTDINTWQHFQSKYAWSSSS
jgi:hypothetical protein